MMVYDVIERRLLLLLLSFSACEYKRAVSSYSRDKYESELFGLMSWWSKDKKSVKLSPDVFTRFQSLPSGAMSRRQLPCLYRRGWYSY
jgi:hypothetical protein